MKELVLSSGYMNSSGGWNHTMSGIMATVITSGSLKEMLQIAREAYGVSGSVTTFKHQVSNVVGQYCFSSYLTV